MDSQHNILSRKYIGFALFLSVMLILSAFSVSAATVNLVNSKDWKDVYSVMLYSKLNDETSFFLNSESITSVTRLLSPDVTIKIYQSKSQPYIENLQSQLSSAGYDATTAMTSDTFNLDLAPKNGNYLLFYEGNYRISISLAPYAVKSKSWVYIVNEKNSADIAKAIKGSNSVVAFGNFRRDILDDLKSSFTEWVNENIYKDSQTIASRYGSTENLVLADGSFLEAEFFATENPVLLSGFNKILDDTYTFLQKQGVKSVVIVGNKLAVIGEQIRTKSDKKISVFVKYGQTASKSSGQVYSLMMFPFPQPTIGLTVTKAVYDPSNKQLVVYFENKGNTGVYELTTLKVITDGKSVADASDNDVVFIGNGEVVPVVYPIDIAVDKITDTTNVEFYTSYGIEPTQLDTFLTMVNKYGPPFSIKLDVAELGKDDSSLTLGKVSYYKNLKRIGVELTNNGPESVTYNVKVNQLIVNGLPQDLSKAGTIAAGETQIAYLNVVLDDVDLEENKEFNVIVLYGKTQDSLFKKIKQTLPFTVDRSSALTGNVIGALSGQGSITIILIIIVLIVGIRIYIKKKSKKTYSDF